MKKRKIGMTLLVIVAMVGIAAVVFSVSGIYDPENNIQGRNQNITWYRRAVGTEAYATIEEAMKSHDEDYKKENLLYTVNKGNVARVFMVNENEVSGYEFIIKEKKYHYIGERKLIVNAYAKDYDWETTLRSDLSYSTKKTYKNIIHIGTKYTICPAWGVSDRAQVKNVTFDGQKVDKVVAFLKGQETYYLWIIDDLKTKNDAADISINLLKTVYNNGKIKEKESGYVSDSQTYRYNPRR